MEIHTSRDFGLAQANDIFRSLEDTFTTNEQEIEIDLSNLQFYMMR